MKRLATSFVLACRDNGFSESFAWEAAAACVRSYRERMAEFSKMHVLDVWYAHIDMEDLIPTVQDKQTRLRIRKRLTEARLLTHTAERRKWQISLLPLGAAEV